MNIALLKSEDLSDSGFHRMTYSRMRKILPFTGDPCWASEGLPDFAIDSEDSGGENMTEDPERIVLQMLLEHADQHYQSADNLWMMWIRRNIVLVRASGKWTVDDTALYLQRYWSIFEELRKTYSKVMFVFDMNHWEIQTEEFRRYLKENWAHILDREDLDVLFVDASPMKRLIWISIFQLIGKRDRLLLFKDFVEAFTWISSRPVKNGA